MSFGVSLSHITEPQNHPNKISLDFNRGDLIKTGGAYTDYFQNRPYTHLSVQLDICLNT